MRVIFRLVNGIAFDRMALRDGRPVPPGFSFVDDTGQDTSLQALSDPAAWAAMIAAQQAKADREAVDLTEHDTAKQDNAVTAMLDRTPAQIANFIDNQATDLAGVRTVLKLFARVLVVVARRTLR